MAVGLAFGLVSDWSCFACLGRLPGSVASGAGMGCSIALGPGGQKLGVGLGRVPLHKQCDTHILIEFKATLPSGSDVTEIRRFSIGNIEGIVVYFLENRRSKIFLSTLIIYFQKNFIKNLEKT